MTSPLHDEAHALPSEEAIAVGAAIQQIVAHETGVADTIDPLGGSYYVELMTRKIEDAVFAEIEKIDAHGRRAARRFERGYFQRSSRASSGAQPRARDGERKLVGQNFAVREEKKRAIEHLSPRRGDRAPPDRAARRSEGEARREQSRARRSTRVREAALGRRTSCRRSSKP